MNLATKAISLITILILGACSSGKSSKEATVITTTQGGTTFSCSAVPLVEEVDSNASFSVSVMVSNGTGPYRLNVGSDTSAFDIGKTIQAKIQNTATETKILSGSVQVLDSTNAAVNCSYSIKVKPENGGLVCAQGGGLLFKQSTNSCVQSLTSCQTSDLKTQGYVEVTTKNQCNTYCGALSTTCNSLPDTDSLVCSIAPRSAPPYFADLKYEFEVKATRNGVPVELTIGTFTATPQLATNEDLGVNPVTKGKIRRISVAKNMLPTNASAIQATLLANAWLASDPNIKCGNNSTGAVPQYPVFIKRPPVLLCSMEILNYYLVPSLYAGDRVFVKIAGRKAGIPIPLRIGTFTRSHAYESWEPLGQDPATGDYTFAFTWNATVIPSGATYVPITLGATAWSSDPNLPVDYCNDDSVGGIAGVSFYLFR